MGVRGRIIKAVQKTADTKNQKIDASIVSRVASQTIDEVVKEIKNFLDGKKAPRPLGRKRS